MLTAGRLTLAAFALALFLAAHFAPPARATDPATALASAESEAMAAEARITEAEAQLTPLKAQYAIVRARAAPVDRQADAAESKLARLEASATALQAHARHRISSLESTHAEEVEDHDEQTAASIGFALALLVAALIALGWDFFRASAPIAWLTERELSQAIGICVGTGLLAVIIGAVLGGSGLLGVLGSLIVGLGLLLPAALLLARHSAEIQRGRAKPVLGRSRLPRALTLTLAGLCGVLFLAGSLGAAFSSGPDAAPISPVTRAAAGPLSPAIQARVAALETKTVQFSSLAGGLDHKRQTAKAALADAQSTLTDAEDDLSSAQSSARRYGARLVALEETEARQAAREEAAAAREAEAAEEEAAEAAAEECNPNYSGCLDPSASDYDCEGGSGDGPLYTGTVEVIGYDEYGLDEDGDGIGCDP